MNEINMHRFLVLRFLDFDAMNSLSIQNPKHYIRMAGQPTKKTTGRPPSIMAGFANFTLIFYGQNNANKEIFQDENWLKQQFFDMLLT